MFFAIPGKTNDEIKERYETTLDTTAKKNNRWTEEEYQILKEEHAKHGNCWKTIAFRLYVGYEFFGFCVNLESIKSTENSQVECYIKTNRVNK